MVQLCMVEMLHLDDMGKLLIASIAGAAIGFERESHGQAAGLRTNILVCTGACLMMLLSLHMEELYKHLDITESVVRLDPGRIASYAIASMGFLGAGAIIKGKGSIKGLTTAAGLWLVTGVGLAIGANFIAPAMATMALSLCFLYGLRRVKLILHRTEFILLTISCSGSCNPLPAVKAILAGYPAITIYFTNIACEPKERTSTYRFRVSHKEPVPVEEIVRQLGEIECVDSINWEESDIP